MGRRWNESDHPRDQVGRFTDSAGGGGGFAQRLSDRIGNGRSGQHSGDGAGGSGEPNRQERDEYNRQIYAEAEAIATANADDEDDDFGDFDTEDTDLGEMIGEMREALEGGDTAKADELADELRRYITSNGYVDDGELPSPPGAAAGGKPSRAEFRGDVNRALGGN